MIRNNRQTKGTTRRVNNREPMVFQSPCGSTAKWRENFAAAFRGFVGDLRRASSNLFVSSAGTTYFPRVACILARICEKNEKRPRGIGYGLTCLPVCIDKYPWVSDLSSPRSQPPPPRYSPRSHSRCQLQGEKSGKKSSVSSRRLYSYTFVSRGRKFGEKRQRPPTLASVVNSLLRQRRAGCCSIFSVDAA